MAKKRKRKSKSARRKNIVVRAINAASEINQAALGFIIPGAGNLGLLAKGVK